MITRQVMLRKVLPAAAVVVCCFTALTLETRSAVENAPLSSVRPATEQGLKLPMWTSDLEKLDRQREEEEARRLEEEERVRRRALTAVGMPAEGLLLAVANSDADAVDEFGHEPSFSPGWHKDLLPMNRYVPNPAVLAPLQDDTPL